MGEENRKHFTITVERDGQKQRIDLQASTPRVNCSQSISTADLFFGVCDGAFVLNLI